MSADPQVMQKSELIFLLRSEQGSARIRSPYHGPAHDIPIWVNSYETRTEFGRGYLSELIKSVHSGAVLPRPV
jgi:hypothetical protein